LDVDVLVIVEGDGDRRLYRRGTMKPACWRTV